MGDRIGFIGLGAMGRPMARNLVSAGFDVVVHNRSAGSVRELVAAGARAAASPGEVARDASVVITMLPATADVEAVVCAPGGVLEGAAPGTLIIDMSTIAPAAAASLAARAAREGCVFLDAPVSGGDVGAAAGTLSIMVGGDAEHVDRARPVLEVLGSTIVHVGAHGAGQTVKACNQIVVAGTIAAISEALVLGASAGVEPGVIVDVLRGGFADSRVLEVRGENYSTRRFEPGFRAALHLKDLGIALETAHRAGVPLPATAAVTQLFAAMDARGYGDRDHSGLVLLVEELSGAAAAR
jgi:2-hydroxy-3-oxopropionate reductase